MRVTQTIAAGLRSLPGAGAAFASTQAAWRCYAKQRLPLAALLPPLRACGQQAGAKQGAPYALLVQDLSDLNYHAHTSKQERLWRHQGQALGSQLHTALLVSEVDGQPLARRAPTLCTAQGLSTSRAEARVADAAPLDQVTALIRHSAAWVSEKPFVPLIDRGGDSGGDYRHWLAWEALFLVRAAARHTVRWQETRALWGDRPAQLALHFSRLVRCTGGQAGQYIAETAVPIQRAARSHRQRHGVVAPCRAAPGPPVKLRLGVSQVRKQAGTGLAQWWLLTNLPVTVAAQTSARWYYWRWKIASSFKLWKRGRASRGAVATGAGARGAAAAAGGEDGRCGGLATGAAAQAGRRRRGARC